MEYLEKKIPCKPMKNKLFTHSFCCLFFFVSIPYIFSEEVKSIKDALLSSPKGMEPTLIYNHLLSNLKNLKTPKEKKKAELFLAEYATRCHLFKEAGEHYIEVFSVSNSLGEKDAKKHLIKALKAFIMGGDIEGGYATYGKILSIKDGEDGAEYNREAELYLQYLGLAESLNEPKIEVSSILKNLKAYAKDERFKKFRHSILLTLWFLQDDAEAKNALLKEVPNGMEAMLISGQAIILPTTFWYLTPYLSLPKEDATTSISQHLPKAYQIGFFKEKTYAIRQKQKLEAMGFAVEINEEKRMEGGIYYAVCVLEKEGGETGIKLKDAGFESFPIFE